MRGTWKWPEGSNVITENGEVKVTVEGKGVAAGKGLAVFP
jgi:hypothetical protein